MRMLLADTLNETQRNRLLAMQADILPADVPMPVDEGLWWLVRENGAWIAFAGMTFRHEGDPLTAFLCRAGVYPRHQGRGIQKQMIRRRLAHAKTLGLRCVVTDTHDNPASANSLIACGFRTYLPEEPWRAPGAVYWKKNLQ